MCSVAEEDGPALEMNLGLQREKNKACVKCGEPGCVVTRIQDSFCKECFQVYVVHKFRAAIGKSKLIRDGERVLVAFSGGHNSSALLHLIQDGLSQRAHKKLRFTPVLLHVDESGVPGLAGDEKSSNIEKVTDLMMTSGYPCFLTNLEMALTLNSTANRNGLTGKENEEEAVSLFWEPSTHSVHCSSPTVERLRERLKGTLNNLATMSSQEDFIHHLRSQLIASIAQYMGFNKVLTAECSTRLAVRILSDIAQGRGSQVALNTGFCDSRRGDLLFLRPVRDLSSKELAIYNFLFQVEAAVPLSLSTKAEPTVSVERLTEHFVMGLQAGYQSTVSNIVRTSEKLGLPELTKDPTCWFCQSPLDTHSGNTSALKAIEVSLQLSKGQGSQGQTVNPGGCDMTNEVDTGQCCGQGDGSCQSSQPPQRLTHVDVTSGLCYGCQLALRDYKGDVNSLPYFITEQASSAKQRQKLRDEIADFLLEDDDDDDEEKTSS